MIPLILILLGINIGDVKLVEPVFKPETLYYTIKMGDKGEGLYTNFIGKEKYEDRDALKLTFITFAGEGEEVFHDTVILYLNPETLNPLYSHRKMAGKINAEIRASYSEGKAKVQLKTQMGSKEVEIDVPEGGVDNEEITYLFRWIDFDGPKKGKLIDVVPSGGTTVDIKWELVGDTLITIGEREFKTYRVELNFLGRKVHIYYERELPRRMVKYIDFSTGTEMTIREK
jgi:hypothetical protein